MSGKDRIQAERFSGKKSQLHAKTTNKLGYEIWKFYAMAKQEYTKVSIMGAE